MVEDFFFAYAYLHYETIGKIALINNGCCKTGFCYLVALKKSSRRGLVNPDRLTTYSNTILNFNDGFVNCASSTSRLCWQSLQKQKPNCMMQSGLYLSVVFFFNPI